MQRSQQLRTATQTRRSARVGFPEPDDFEGLPVRQWRQEWVNVAPSAQQEMTQQGDRWAVELPYGMPRESNLLPPHTQELLRAARSGRLYKRPAPAEEEDQDAEIDAVKGEKKDWEPPNEGFMVKVWKQVPRNAEIPEISHLAKRQKNTVTLASKAAAPQLTGPTVIRATVRRIDAAGNPYEQTVTLSEGQQVDGEIISTTVVPAPAAAQGELPLQPATPVRRRPPPPKRKAKGAGRGRKKGKLPLPAPATRSQAGAADGSAPVKSENVGPEGIKIEDTEDSTNQDSEMADVSGVVSEDEEGDGGDGEEEEEGDEAGDEEAGETPGAENANADARVQESEDLEMSEAIQPSSVEEPDEPHPVSEEAEEVTITKARLQPPSLTNLAPPHLGSSRIEGSPLKNVMILSPTEPSPMVSPRETSTSLAASGYLDSQPRTIPEEAASGNTAPQAHAAETTAPPGILPPLRAHRPSGSGAPQNPSTPSLPAQKAPDGPTDATPQPEPTEAQEEPNVSAEPAASEPSAPASAPGPAPAPAPAPATTLDPTEPASEVSLLQPPDSPALLPTVTADEDDGLNLLGSLERELDRREGVSDAGGGSEEVGAANANADGSGSGGGNGSGNADAGDTAAAAENPATAPEGPAPPAAGADASVADGGGGASAAAPGSG